MNDSIKGLLGFAMRAGQVVVGAAQAEALIGRGKAALVLLDEQAAQNTRDKLTRKSLTAGVPVRNLPKQTLGLAIGRLQTVAAALAKGTIADTLIHQLPPTDSQDPHYGTQQTAEAIN